MGIKVWRSQEKKEEYGFIGPGLITIEMEIYGMIFPGQTMPLDGHRVGVDGCFLPCAYEDELCLESGTG